MNAPADSFAFSFKNISNSKKSVELFQLGLTNAFTPVTRYLAQDIDGSTSPVWNSNNSYQQFADLWKQNPLNPYPNGTSNQDVIWKGQTFITRIAMADTIGNIFFTDLPISYTGDIEDISIKKSEPLYEELLHFRNFIDGTSASGCTVNDALEALRTVVDGNTNLV